MSRQGATVKLALNLLTLERRLYLLSVLLPLVSIYSDVYNDRVDSV